jgi:inner membrane protein
MSSKTVHYCSGVLLGVAAAWATSDMFSPWQSLTLFAGCLLGSSAPDTLEIKTWLWGTRLSVIPHRRITHWMLGWIVATGWMAFRVWQGAGFLWCVALGYCLSSLLHVYLDYRTPMSVPVFHPWRRARRSNAR